MLKKFKEGLLLWLGFMFMVWITSLSYAAFNWVTQTNVSDNDTLTASAWNNMIANQNYLKQETEKKLLKAGDSMSWELNMGSNKVTNLATPTANTDAATKAYADSVSAAGGNYQISCTKYNPIDPSNSDPMKDLSYCLRLNTTTGVTDCKTTSNSHPLSYNTSSWINCHSKPW